MTGYLFPLVFMAVFGGLWGLASINPMPITLQAGSVSVQAQSQAEWLSHYRDAVVSWALANPGFTGAVNNSALTLAGFGATGITTYQAGGWVVGPVSARTVVVYATVASASLSYLDTSFATISRGAWMGQGGSVALPAALASAIPANDLVSLTELGGV